MCRVDLGSRVSLLCGLYKPLLHLLCGAAYDNDKRTVRMAREIMWSYLIGA